MDILVGQMLEAVEHGVELEAYFQALASGATHKEILEFGDLADDEQAVFWYGFARGLGLSDVQVRAVSDLQIDLFFYLKAWEIGVLHDEILMAHENGIDNYYYLEGVGAGMRPAELVGLAKSGVDLSSYVRGMRKRAYV